MRAAIFNPYLDSLGGGERYTMAVAQILLKSGWEVDVQWKDDEIKSALERRFGIELGGVGFIPDIKRGEGYDLCFWVTDGSIPLLHSRKNILHFQVPFHDVGGNTLLNKMKLFRVSKIICNSNFTKRVVDEEYGINSVVVYPPVAVDKIKPKAKENIILSVGRFSQMERSKRQDVLISAFKKFYDSGNRGWKLVLAGGVEVGDDTYTSELKQMSKGYPVTILKSPEFRVIKDLYSRSKVSWFASGWGVDENRRPENVEHFGIVLVEAMAAGCVPFAFESGGHREIIEHGVNGFLWKETEELVGGTVDLISDPKAYRALSIKARTSSQKYSYAEFEKNLLKNI